MNSEISLKNDPETLSRQNEKFSRFSSWGIFFFRFDKKILMNSTFLLKSSGRISISISKFLSFSILIVKMKSNNEFTMPKLRLEIKI